MASPIDSEGAFGDNGVFGYSNVPLRRPGPVVRIGSVLVPGIRQVQSQVVPYAQKWRQHNLAALAEPGPLWVVLGDSLSQGIGASEFGQGWVGQAARLLAEGRAQYRVVNLSMSGARIADVTHRQIPVLQSLQARPELVTLLVGSNDLMRRSHREQAAADFAALLELLPMGTVVGTLPNPHATALRVNSLSEEAAEAGRIALATIHQRPAASWRGKLAADFFHLNDAGYAELAEVFVAAIGARQLDS